MILEESNCGDTKYRLIETETGHRRIELWSSLSKQWKQFGRYDVDERWKNLKKRNEAINKDLAERADRNKKPLRSRKRVGSAGKQQKK